ncbi:Protein kinase-like domain protein [Metarhizium rileyi]|uniref:EKC/KEOPS complex subunit BUD32 n=1 Tax=Metarhizium rileyi (strain RCEF 4871) TaxID=1649241 RepID=A0A162HVY4_METRR|nr:Protein kinase-like domain protein [Metarhizium rileyi RCEF 4871]
MTVSFIPSLGVSRLWHMVAVQYRRVTSFLLKILYGVRQTGVVEDRAPNAAHTCPRHLVYNPIPGPWRRELSPALPENAYQIPDRHDIPHGKIYYITKGHFIGCGATSFVEKLSSGNIVKSPKPNPYCPHEEVRCRQELMVEFEVYRRIGSSSRVPALIDWDADSHCLILEYLENGDLVSYLRQHASRVTAKQRQDWTVQAAEALAVIHQADVIHCDVTPRNFILNGTLELHIADFAGSSVAGSLPTVTTSPRFQPPG